jgi:hypothetical protein
MYVVQNMFLIYFRDYVFCGEMDWFHEPKIKFKIDIFIFAQYYIIVYLGYIIVLLNALF